MNMRNTSDSKVLVTGASGFLGRVIVNVLTQQGVPVRALIRNEERRSVIPVNIDILVIPDLFSASADEFAQMFQGISHVIHCAWYVDHRDYLSNEQNVQCMTGTINFALQAKKSGVKKFVGIGTCFEYADSGLPLGANAPIGPDSLYSSCKASTYLVLKQVFNDQNTEFCWCRVFYLYGDGEPRSKLHSYVREKISKDEAVELGRGVEIRDYIDAKDAATQIVDATFDNAGVVNICSGEGISVWEIATSIAEKNRKLHLLRFNTRPAMPSEKLVIIGKRG